MKLFGINFFSTKNTSKSEGYKRLEHFNVTMELAHKIAIKNPQALHELIRALLRPLQSEHLLAVAERPDHQAPEPIAGHSFFFSNIDIFSSHRYLLRDKPIIKLNLTSDLILPTPWRRDRYESALTEIGTGKIKGEWKQDSINHVVSLCLPWGIGFVTGGNHSISAGILAGENATVIAEEVFDFSPIFKDVECDGTYYRSKHDGKILAEVIDHRKAAVFEIGRLLLQNNVRFFMK
jgi:hypothetical protein